MKFHTAAPLIAVIVLLLIVMSACTTKVAVPREGRHLGDVPVQEREQCVAQPDFPGCENVGR